MSTFSPANNPIRCAYTADEYGKKYLVYMRRDDDGVFVISVGKDYFKRYMTLDIMPDEVKMCLAMIHAYDWDKYPNVPPQSHHPDYPEELRDTGWMTAPGEYTVVLSDKTLSELQGSKAYQMIR